MKILQIITLSELGGAQSVVINLANRLADKNEVMVVAGQEDGKMWSLLNAAVKQECCPYLQRALSPINDLLTVFYFRKLYLRYKPDIIHLHSSKAGLLGRLAFPPRKIIYTVHGFDSIRLAYRKYLPLERMMQFACKAIVGVSRYDEKNLITEGIKHQVSCVYNGITPPAPAIGISLDLPSKYAKIVLCIARLSPQKNSALFMSIAALLPEYAFVWLGNQTPVDEHPGNVFFMGNILGASRYNAIADLFILPTNYEGLPIVIIEAMSYGKPVVASDVGGISEIVKTGETGYVVKNDATAFAEKIKYLLENEKVYKRFSENARIHFEKELTVDKMTSSYLEIYNSK